MKIFLRISACLLAIAVTGCGGGGGIGSALRSPSMNETATQSLVKQLAPDNFDVTTSDGADVPFRFTTAPGARCVFGGPTSQPFYADQSGNIEFHIGSTPRSSANASVTISCRQGGTVVTTKNIALHRVAGAAQVPEIKRTLPSKTVVPSSSSRQVQDYVGALTSGNWSGLVVLGNSYDYRTASAEWYTPAVNPYSVTQAYVEQNLFWIGLDGWTSGDVMQNGTASVAYNTDYTSPSTFSGKSTTQQTSCSRPT